MVIGLELGADLHMAQLIPLPLTSLASVKSRLVLPFWYRLTQVVPDKGQLNGCVCVLYLADRWWQLRCRCSDMYCIVRCHNTVTTTTIASDDPDAAVVKSGC